MDQWLHEKVDGWANLSLRWFSVFSGLLDLKTQPDIRAQFGVDINFR
jgi:hypothetical protein